MHFSSVQLLSHVQLFATPRTTTHQPLCPSPTTRVYPNSCPWIGDAIQPSCPLSSPSPPAFNLSQHQGHFKWVSSSHQVAKVLEFQLQHQSFQGIFNWFPLGWTGWISLLSKGLLRVLWCLKLTVNGVGFVISEEETGRSLWEVLEISTVLIVVMVSSVFVYAQTHQDLHSKRMQLSVGPLYLNKTI